mgnify:CR=1 FL=1
MVNVQSAEYRFGSVVVALDQLRAAIDEYRLQYPELFGKAK